MLFSEEGVSPEMVVAACPSVEYCLHAALSDSYFLHDFEGLHRCCV